MSCRTAECYKAVFKFIEDNICELKPTEFITDFELGMRKAINDFYPNARLRGCWFHYCRAIKRKATSLGLFIFIRDDKKANRIYYKMLMLPLLPSQQFMEAYNIVKQEANRDGVFGKFKSLFGYYDSYWLVQVSISFVQSGVSMLNFFDHS